MNKSAKQEGSAASTQPGTPVDDGPIRHGILTLNKSGSAPGKNRPPKHSVTRNVPDAGKADKTDLLQPSEGEPLPGETWENDGGDARQPPAIKRKDLRD